MADQHDYLEQVRQGQVASLAQLIDALGWRVLDPTLPKQVSRDTISRLASLLEYLKLRDQADE